MALNPLNSSRSMEIPFNNAVVEREGLLSLAWASFFRELYRLISHIGFETSFDFVNNSTGDINGLKFDPTKGTQVFIDYVIQRITSTTELIETGTLAVVYKPKAGTWSVFKSATSGPDNAGITFSITSGQLKYTSSNMSGVSYIHKFTYRTRAMQAKLVKPSGGWM